MKDKNEKKETYKISSKNVKKENENMDIIDDSDVDIKKEKTSENVMDFYYLKIINAVGVSIIGNKLVEINHSKNSIIDDIDINEIIKIPEEYHSNVLKIKAQQNFKKLQKMYREKNWPEENTEELESNLMKAKKIKSLNLSKEKIRHNNNSEKEKSDKTDKMECEDSDDLSDNEYKAINFIKGVKYQNKFSINDSPIDANNNFGISIEELKNKNSRTKKLLEKDRNYRGSYLIGYHTSHNLSDLKLFAYKIISTIYVFIKICILIKTEQHSYIFFQFIKDYEMTPNFLKEKFCYHNEYPIVKKTPNWPFSSFEFTEKNNYILKGEEYVYQYIVIGRILANELKGKNENKKIGNGINHEYENDEN